MEILATSVVSEEVAIAKGVLAEFDAIDIGVADLAVRRNTAEDDYRHAYDKLSTNAKELLAQEQHELNGGFPYRTFGKFN